MVALWTLLKANIFFFETLREIFYSLSFTPLCWRLSQYHLIDQVFTLLFPPTGRKDIILHYREYRGIP